MQMLLGYLKQIVFSRRTFSKMLPSKLTQRKTLILRCRIISFTTQAVLRQGAARHGAFFPRGIRPGRLALASGVLGGTLPECAQQAHSQPTGRLLVCCRSPSLVRVLPHVAGIERELRRECHAGA